MLRFFSLLQRLLAMFSPARWIRKIDAVDRSIQDLIDNEKHLLLRKVRDLIWQEKSPSKKPCTNCTRLEDASSILTAVKDLYPKEKIDAAKKDLRAAIQDLEEMREKEEPKIYQTVHSLKKAVGEMDSEQDQITVQLALKLIVR